VFPPTKETGNWKTADLALCALSAQVFVVSQNANTYTLPACESSMGASAIPDPFATLPETTMLLEPPPLGILINVPPDEPTRTLSDALS
jgi:hypothetical protein